MHTRLVFPASLQTVWQRSQILLDPGSWEIKARFGNDIYITTSAQESIRLGIPTSLPAFTAVWIEILARARAHGWQSTWLDRLYGPELTIVTTATATPAHLQVWQQFATSVQAAVSFVSASDIQAEFLMSLRQKHAAVGLHIGHQKTEVFLLAKTTMVAKTTLRWELAALTQASLDQRRWQAGRWGWELWQWLSLQHNHMGETDCVLVVSGGGSYRDIVATVGSVGPTRSIIRLQEPEFFLINTNPQIVPAKP